jgi:hypothetical protein
VFGTAKGAGSRTELRAAAALVLRYPDALEEEMTKEVFGLAFDHGELDILDDEPKWEVYDRHHLDFSFEDES